MIDLQWKHLHLDGDRPHAKVRRASVKGRMQPPKSRPRRDVPIDHQVVRDLRTHRKTTEWPAYEQLVFASATGTVLHVENVRNRCLKPAAQEAGAP